VHLAVAVEAVFAEQVVVGLAGWQALGAVGLAGVKGGGMALLAQGGTPGSEQAVVDRTVGPVTQAAVFCHRGMFPQEGPAFLLVARQAVVVDRQLHQVRIAQASMGIVAVAAAGFTLFHRVP
jgi:hypothetical protein